MTGSASGDPPAGGTGGVDPAAVLLDVPAPLWGELLRALRRALDRMPRMELPGVLRPYAGWTPDALAAPHPRRAVARAIAGDARLREEIAESLDDRDALAEATWGDGPRLAEAHGVDVAVAVLSARGRWADLALLAADAVERQASRNRAVAEAAATGEDDDEGDVRRRLSASLAEARAEGAAQRRRAEAAEDRAMREDAARREDQAELARLRARVAELEREVVEERRRRDRRVGRLQRRVEEAEARARMDDARVDRVRAELDRLSEELRAALATPSPPSAADGAAPAEPERATVPRTVTAAAPGRPCVLPAGVRDDSPMAVRALLQVPGLETVVDGYNVTRHPRGRPHASLADQRQWLVKLAGAVTARFRARVTVVFDGTEERPGPPPAARGVRVVFTSGEEIADERITDIVRGLSPDVPVLVVSSDRELGAAAAARGANVVSAATFLAAVDS